MCGLIALVALQRFQLETNTVSNLDAGLEQIKHRGPDSQGKWISSSGRTALGHVRLKINDLSPTGHQPLHDADQTVHAVVNGEIYDYDRLRAEMVEQIGYKFQGTSDCELVLALYKCYGLSFLSNIRGEFSLCLYDSEYDLFIAVRDRYGIKPLFWTVLEGELLVAAEMKAFAPLGWKPEWDVNGIVNGSYQMGAKTIFKGVQKVLPGHYLLSDSTRRIDIRQYWDMDYPPKLEKETRGENEMIQGIRTRLLEAIRIRLKADVKVGVALSGGIDSSVVAGMVNHLIREGEKVGSDLVNERLSCFAIAFDEDSGFDESPTANRTADHLGVRYYKKHMDEKSLADSFEDATWVNEQPNPDLNYIGLFALSDLVRQQGYHVILNGQGADEIFGGYPLFLTDFLLESDQSFHDPSGLDEISRKTAFSKTIKRMNGDPTPSTASNGSDHHGTILTPTYMANAYPTLPLKEEHLRGLGTVSTTPRSLYLSSLPPEQLTKLASLWHPFHSGQYVFTKAHLENLILSNLGDRGEMAHSIEGRTPFLDHHLTEYANGLPPSMKIRPIKRKAPENESKATDENLPPSASEYDFIEKYVLREAARPFVTDEIYKKRKHPYSAPLQYKPKGPLHRLMGRLITEEKINHLGFLAWKSDKFHGGKSLGELVDLAFAEKDEAVFRLVICLAQWVVLGKRFGVRTATAAPVSKALLPASL